MYWASISIEMDWGAWYGWAKVHRWKYWRESIQKRQEGVLAAWKRIEQHSSVLTRDEQDCMIKQDSSVFDTRWAKLK